jgi:hypothetical protein
MSSARHAPNPHRFKNPSHEYPLLLPEIERGLNLIRVQLYPLAAHLNERRFQFGQRFKLFQR